MPPCNNSFRFSISSDLNPGENQTDAEIHLAAEQEAAALEAAARQAIANLPLAVKIGRQDIRIKSIVDYWIFELNTNERQAKRKILELIFHCIQEDKRPLRLEDFRKLQSLTLLTFDDWLTKMTLILLPTDSVPYSRIYTFMEEAFTVQFLVKKEVIGSIHDFLSIMVRSHSETARFTGGWFASLMICIYMDHYQSRDVINECTRDKMFEWMRTFMKVIHVLLGDDSPYVRKRFLTVFSRMCMMYPAIFINSSSLHHLLFLLVDRNPQLRVFALKSYQFILSVDWIYDFEQIKYRTRLLSLLISACFDGTKEVAEEAIKTLTDFYSKYPEERRGREFKTIVLLLLSEDQRIAARAATLLYLTLQPVQDDAIEFNNQIVTLINYIRNTLDIWYISTSDIEKILIRHLLPLAADQLTNWNAWLELFLGDKLSINLANMGCPLFLRIVKLKCCTTIEVERDKNFLCVTPLFSLLDQAKQPKLTQEHKNQIKLHQQDVTMTFGEKMIELWDMYKEDKCLKDLLKIPQVFVASETLELKSIFDYLIHVKTRSYVCLSEVYQTMASILQLMRTSNMWSADIPALEKYVFSYCGNSLFFFCERYTTIKYSLEKPMDSDVASINIAYFVTKFFDMSGTGLMQNSIIALQYGVAQRNLLITKNAAYMCVYNIHWQLKSILEKNHSVEERKRRKESLCYYICETICAAEPLIIKAHEEFLVRVFVNIYSYLCTVFSSGVASIHSEVALSLTPILSCDWLRVYVPAHEVPKDPVEHTMAKCAVQQFCWLLSSGAMDTSYFASILPYFQLYRQQENYNASLQEAIEHLIVHEDFHVKFIGALAHCRRFYTVEQMQVIVKGVTTAGVQKVEVSEVQRFAKSVLTEAIFYICRKENDLISFPLFVPFLRLLSQQDAEYLSSVVLECRPSLSDSIYLKQFIDGIQSQIHTR